MCLSSLERIFPFLLGARAFVETINDCEVSAYSQLNILHSQPVTKKTFCVLGTVRGGLGREGSTTLHQKKRFTGVRIHLATHSTSAHTVQKVVIFSWQGIC